MALAESYPFYVANQPEAPNQDLEVVDKYSGEVATRVALADDAAIDRAIALAVEATKGGNFMGACAQWDELGRAYPRAPAVLHNLGACAEARGDMETAQLRYARAAELASGLPLLKDKKARPSFGALSWLENNSRGFFERKIS